MKTRMGKFVVDPSGRAAPEGGVTGACPTTPGKRGRSCSIDVAEATDQLALALASLGEAYEELDEQTADALEEQLFRPTQSAYGRLRRTHAEFAGRHGLPGREFEASSGGLHSADPRVYVDRAIEAIERADQRARRASGLDDAGRGRRPRAQSRPVGDAIDDRRAARARPAADANPGPVATRARWLMRTQGR